MLTPSSRYLSSSSLASLSILLSVSPFTTLHYYASPYSTLSSLLRGMIALLIPFVLGIRCLVAKTVGQGVFVVKRRKDPKILAKEKDE